MDPSVTAKLLNKAAKGASKSPPSPLDVWSHSVSGMQEQMKNFDPTAPPAPVQAAQNLGKAVSSDWASSSPEGVAKGMAQQAGAVKKQLAKLFHADDKPAEGVLGHIGAAFGVVTAVEQLVSMPLSLIPFPALPAVRIMDMDVGLPHAHAHPPNTFSVPPMMLPSTGPVIPIPFVSGAATVLINGMPAARCGDMGLGIWCGGYFPLYEIFLGSSNVWLEGARAARLGVDITKHCIFSTPKPSDPPLGPMVGFTISASGNVNIGGVPMPSLSSKATGAAFKAAFKGLGKAARMLRGALGKGGKLKRNVAVRPVRSNPGRYGPSTSVGTTSFMTRQSYQRACELIDQLKASQKLKIKGSPEFIAKAERDLRLIASSNTGRRMMEDIQSSGKKVILLEGGPSAKAASSIDAALDQSHPGGARPGPGSDSVVKYNPDEWMGSNSPPDTVLAHEMGHARNAAKGEDLSDMGFHDARDRARWSDGEEMQTIENIENPYRRERGLEERTGHDDSP
jgi:uncharacterized Zn-binding protein involved in type VI secretion